MIGVQQTADVRAHAYTIDTPDGIFSLVTSDNALLASGWASADYFLGRLGIDQANANTDEPAPGSLMADAIAAVNDYYAGDLDAPEQIPVDQPAPQFHHKVHEALHQTKPGDRLTYSDLAALAGNPRAVRAAASACARNKTALFIPCHRVIRRDGSLGGFLYGLPLKQSLLDRELGIRPDDR